jgi:hypothetical protein
MAQRLLPIAWTTKKYKMIYTNMGHNDMDYEGKTNAQLFEHFQQSGRKYIHSSTAFCGLVV